MDLKAKITDPLDRLLRIPAISHNTDSEDYGYLEGEHLWILYHEPNTNPDRFLKFNFPKAYDYHNDQLCWNNYTNQETIIWHDFMNKINKNKRHRIIQEFSFTTFGIKPASGRYINHIIIKSKVHPEDWYPEWNISSFKNSINAVYHFHKNENDDTVVDVYDNYKNFIKATK